MHYSGMLNSPRRMSDRNAAVVVRLSADFRPYSQGITSKASTAMFVPPEVVVPATLIVIV